MSVPEIVHRLVDRFEEDRKTYLSTAYKEEWIRQDFVNPLFEALGWDVANRRGVPVGPQREVVPEERLKGSSVKGSRSTTAPDYAFRLGGARKFFVEAKKPSVKLEGAISPAFQLRRYAWSAKLPLSILTDFEEFATYDCRYEPKKHDGAAVARLGYMTYEEYPDRWDEIASIFSKEAVLSGSLEKYAEETKRKRGTETVDAAFLREIEGWRSALARDLATHNDLNRRQLNYAVQMTIDRIIFLRMAEDRGIEDYGTLLGILEGYGVYSRLLTLFKQADNRYNSGLFHFHPERDRKEDPDTLTPTLAVSDRLLRGIIQDLYYPESPYEFSVLPVDVLGQVYEQFLGKVIRLEDGHKAVVEEKPEVRKAGGVYYTPTYIVDYIVEHTVGKLLEGKRPGPKGGASKLKIVDPACGSGSFLIGAYQYLLDWHRNRYLEDGADDKWPKQLYQGPGGEWRLTIDEKKRILLKNIHGVDIDPQAVEVTKLSLLLKVLEGETDETLESQLRLFAERALPDLDENIKCGNSLIGPDFYDDTQTSLLDKEEHDRINVFSWERSFPRIFSGENPGFDAVIGNPPYGAYLHETEKGYLISKYPHQRYQLDSYLLFLEQAIENLIKRTGFYGMIIPNPWLTNLLQTKIRKLVLETTRIHEIVHFLFTVFPKVTVDTQIVILQKGQPEQWNPLVTVVPSFDTFQRPSESDGVKQISHEQQKWCDLDGGTINIFTSQAEEQLAEKCQAIGVPLNSLFNINVGIKPYQAGKGKPPQTKEDVDARPYDSNQQEDPSFRPYLRGGDIGRYQIAPLQPRYLKYGPWLAEPRPAADFDAPVKVVMRQTGDSLIAAVDTHQYLCLNNMHVLVPKARNVSPFYSLGVINSRLLNWHYHTLNPEVGEALAEVKKTNVAKLPIRTIDFSHPEHVTQHDRMVELVEQMMALQKRLAEAKIEGERTVIQHQIDATDRQIDRLVYELYGLTDEEITIVEEATSS